MKNINISSYHADGFIGRYQQLVKDTVIPYQYNVLCDKADNTEKSHVVANFVNAAKALRGEDVGDGFYGMVFQDSDAAKWIEACAYSLAAYPDEELEHRVDELIDVISDAQDDDGYLNTYYTIKDKDKRWTNLLEGHELYCSGHMIEAACAYYEATGKRKLLDVMVKNAEHIYSHFIAEKIEGVPGHPEIELALMRLYDITGNEHFFELSREFLYRRGQDPDIFVRERKRREWTVWGSDGRDPDYMQCGRPVTEQTEATGHAVRAVYLYTGMAMLANSGDEKMLKACETLWENITKRRMYITGGIGSTVQGEAFTVDYDLPPDTAYCETCASIGLMFFASQMLAHDTDRKYADVMERAFYNTVLAGMQLDGKRFFYVNPLECDTGISGKAVTHRHDLTMRPQWYACACCPPNAARLIMSFGKYAYAENDDTVFCHLYAGGRVTFQNGCELTCETDYPNTSDIRFAVNKCGSANTFAVRIPSWSDSFSLKVNGKEKNEVKKGYAYIGIKDGDEICLSLDARPRFIYPSSRIPTVAGMVSVARGPLVYCFEGIDNNGTVSDIVLDTSSEITEGSIIEKLNSSVSLSVSGAREKDIDELYTDHIDYTPVDAVAVPYYTWANRGENRMRVWMRRK